MGRRLAANTPNGNQSRFRSSQINRKKKGRPTAYDRVESRPRSAAWSPRPTLKPELHGRSTRRRLIPPQLQFVTPLALLSLVHTQAGCLSRVALQTHTQTYTHKQTHTHTHTHARTHIRITYMYIYMYIHVYMHVYIIR